MQVMTPRRAKGNSPGVLAAGPLSGRNRERHPQTGSADTTAS